MQKVKISKRVGRQLYRSSPTILTVVASIGVVTTTITAVRATPKAIKMLKEAESEKGENLTKLEIIRAAGPTYIPSVLLGVSTIACIFGASLRGSSEVVAARIRDEIQKRVSEAGLEILEARITYLAYAPEIAAVMLQRQQASAIIDARKMIVDGAVGMVEMALDRLSEKKVVELDEERKAAMVSNLLVVLCGNKDAQPIVNSGSLY